MLIDKEQYNWNLIGQEEQNIDDIVLSVSILYFLTKKYNIETEYNTVDFRCGKTKNSLIKNKVNN